MKKHLNEKNLKFIAQVATSAEGFNLLTAVQLCIDEWYLGNPINERPAYKSVARSEFNKLLFGKKFNTIGESHQSELMINALGEFFEEYIAPKYVLLQKFTYNFLDNLKQDEPDDIYRSNVSGWTYDDYKLNHWEQIIDLVKGEITDWSFGFDDNDEAKVESKGKVNTEVEFKVINEPSDGTGMLSKFIAEINKEQELAKAANKKKAVTKKVPATKKAVKKPK
jgi:hypothetical protein